MTEMETNHFYQVTKEGEGRVDNQQIGAQRSTVVRAELFRHEGSLGREKNLGKSFWKGRAFTNSRTNSRRGSLWAVCIGHWPMMVRNWIQ